MTQEPDPAGDLLPGAWGHSFEEDHDGVAVYRPAGFAFPRARGRGGLELHPDGTFLDVDAGPGDAGRAREGSWETAEQDRLRLRGPAGERTLRIVHLSPERLELGPGDA